MSRVYIYVVDRDFGFAPNPFNGYCSLATCKPRIRNKAKIGDWIVGMGGSRLNATGRCVFAMRVSEVITFDNYWANPDHALKKPIRNGSLRSIVGDNIYHFDNTANCWLQADSHHSHPDGKPNVENISRDTQSKNVLLSNHFFYFGRNAQTVPAEIIAAVGFKNGIGHRVFSIEHSEPFIRWLSTKFPSHLNKVSGDPFDFESGAKRFSVKTNRVT